MGAQVSGTLVNAQLSPATQTADTTKPTSTITSIAGGAHVAGGSQVVVKGSATDTAGVVARVEVSVDGGTTWHPASGTAAWTYAWNVNAVAGPQTIKTRAADDSANLETPGAGVTVTIDPAVCPCTLFHATDAPAAQTAIDAQSVEIGVRFSPDQSGYVNGVRFYKQGSNTGTHVGTLWSNTGQKLAQATFANETATGWQQVLFGAPVAVSGGTTYVASYHAPSGGYSSTLNTFALAGVDNSPVHAPRDGLGGFGNGVFQYSANTPNVPTWSTANSTNYWVDLVFNTSRVDSVLPTVVSNASIGRNGGPSGSGNFQGKLDDVRIWNTVRTPAQISANYHAELSGAQPGLVGNWKFNEGSGTTAADTAASPQNATLNGGATYATDVHP